MAATDIIKGRGASPAPREAPAPRGEQGGLRVEGLRKSYGQRAVVRDVSLHVGRTNPITM